jgi:hypothetical protein
VDKQENWKPERDDVPDVANLTATQEPVEVLDKSISTSGTIQSLLKSPERVAARISEGGFGALTRNLVIVCAACCLGYGLIMGSFSGGAQWYAAPIKSLMGLFVTSLFCLPSLYIFACMSGADVKLGQIAVILIAANTLTSVLLIGLGPIAWVFSQSTNSVFFMGLLHLLFWSASFVFGMKLILRLTRQMKPKDTVYLRIWIVIFLLTSFQMMTALRPLIGTSEHFFPKEKKFFIRHWFDTAGSDADRQNEKDRDKSLQSAEGGKSRRP